MIKKNNKYKIILYLIFLSLLFFPKIIFAQQIKYFELRDLKNPFRFYNEIDEYELYNYFYYYKVFYNESNKITRFEYYSQDNLSIYGEYTWKGDTNCIVKIFKYKISPSNGKSYFSLKYSYEVIFKNGKIKQYTIFKVDEFGTTIKIGKAVFSYPNPVMEIIQNYFNEMLIGKVVIYFKDGNRMQERIYDNQNKIKRINIFKNNKLFQFKIYVYSSDGKVLQVKTYDNKGKLINN